MVKEELITEEVPADDSEEFHSGSNYNTDTEKVVEVNADIETGAGNSSPINTIEGVEDTFTQENIPVHIDGLGDFVVNIVNGRGTLILDGSIVSSEHLSGSITISEDNILYFNIYGIHFVKPIADAIKMENLRITRDQLLSECDWMIIRHITQKDLDIDTSLSDQQFENLETYMQSLRDLPETVEDIDNIQWPVNPLNNSNSQ